MLQLYDYLDELITIRKIEQKSDIRLNFFAGEIMNRLGVNDPDELQSAMSRTIKVFRSMNIPVRQHVKRFYKYADGNLMVDWKISPLTSYLLVLNADPTLPEVAKAQLFLATRLEMTPH